MAAMTWWMAGSLLAAAAHAQEPPKMTARELFYTPVSTAQPAKPADRPKAPPARSRRQEPPPPAVKQEAPIVRQDAPPPRQTVHTVSAVQAAPFAIRYSLLKQAGDEYVEVDPETVFRSGDRIRVSVEANDAAYLYIVQQGSSRTWNVLFPNADTEHGDNRIERNRRVVIPGGGSRFAFDEQPGTERLFLIVSRQPETDMESLIYRLSQNPQSENAPRVLMASAKPIDDEVISRLRGKFLARDLVFEKVDARTSGPRKETAMYVASEDRTPNARVVVDLKLEHR